MAVDGPQIIRVDRLSKVYAGRARLEGVRALDEISFGIAPREFVCLVGPSGCGKSTILNILAGLDRNFTGEVELGGRRLGGGGTAATRVGYVFQEPRLLPWLTVRQNLHFAMESAGLPRPQWQETADRWLSRVGLEGFSDAYPHELSGGMQQRASIARAFSVSPEVLLMDEPFSGLDELTARVLREEVLSLWQEARKTVLFVTHNCFEACFLADRILVLEARPGRIKHEMPIDLPRPRDYESSDLFQLSVATTHLLLESLSLR